MAQWVNHLWNNIFVNTSPLPLLCEISGALHLAQPGLMAGWLAGGRAGRLAGRRNTGEFRNFQVEIFDLSLHLTKVQHHYSLTNAFQLVFRVKPIARLVFKAQNFPEVIRFSTYPYY